MSGSAKGRTFPKTGRILPGADRVGDLSSPYAAVIAATLKQELQRGASVKTIMKWTGAGERTVKVWLTGTSGPRGDHLIGLLAASDAVLDRVLALAGRDAVLDRQKLELFQSHLDELSTKISQMLNR